MAALKFLAEEWPTISRRLDEALSIAPRERDIWLDSLYETDSIKAKLRNLLSDAVGVETDDFLGSLPKLTLGIDEKAVDGGAHGAAVGALIGPYRLIRELGVGGMGAVWLAERIDGGLKRQVALKLPRMTWSRGLAARMSRERDILASLDHPNIARIYDAGLDEHGRPYLALEYVEGEPINAYCKKHALSVRARLLLVLQVSRAVAHAHARLVVHRDLKPANILVNAEGQVRLLDFGIAKLMEGELTQETQLTQQSGRALTLDYASPEQIRGEPIGTASDVYSLGIVAYELLTEAKPYQLKRQSAAALEEAIASVDILLASTASSNKIFSKDLRGDLDAILNKALKKNVIERYPSVDAFTQDIERHLANLPVQAQPDTVGYRIRKFLGRNRFPIALAVIACILVTTGISVVLYQARAVRIEAARAEQVKQFIASIFTQAKPRDGAGGTVTASDLLTSAADRIEKELSSNARVAAELGVLVGEGFAALGEEQKGEAPLRAAVARAEQQYGRQHPTTVHSKRLLVESIGDRDSSISGPLLAELIPDALAGLPRTAEDAVSALCIQAVLLAKRNRADDSYAAIRQAISIGDKYLGELHPATITAVGLLSNTFARFTDRDQQLIAGTEAMRRAQLAFGKSRPHLGLSQAERWYADALRANDRPGDAEPIARHVLQDQRALDTVDTVRVMYAARQLASTLDSVGKSDEALSMAREAVAIEARLNKTETDERRALTRQLASVLVNARRVDEASALETRMAELSQRLGNEPETWLLRNGVRRARVMALKGDNVQATKEAGDTAQRAGEKYPQYRAEALLVAAFNSRMQLNPSEAQEYAQRARSSTDATKFPSAIQALIASEMGNAWLELGDVVKAQKLLDQSRNQYALAQVEPSVKMADCILGLARLHIHASRSPEAETILLPLVRAWEQANPNSEWHGETLYWLSQAQSAVGKTREANENRNAAAAMLKKSNLPALQRLRASK
jgi:eukaryotic-like serine/threonine-protein kinase